MKMNYNQNKTVIKKTCKLIFSPAIAKRLLEKENYIVGIKPDKFNKEKTIFAFEITDKFNKDLDEILEDNKKERENKQHKK